eukprot:164597_1
MGNQVVSTTVNWSALSESSEKCEISDAKDILTRLNIDFPEVDNEEKANDMAQYLDQYLNKLSDDDLQALFLRFGVNPDFDDTTDKETKTSALVLIASNDYWRNNWQLHPAQKRVKNWIFVHNKYREYMNEIVQTAQSDLDSAKALFVKFDKKIIAHSEFEDTMLFKFFKENIDESVMSQNVLNELSNDHNDLVPKLTEKLTACTELAEFQNLMKEYQTHTLQHMQKEEQNIVHVWLNLNEEQYAQYRQYLSWKYAAVY